MRIGIIGAGGIGGYLAARLSNAGADVALVVRGEHGAAIRAQGLLLRAPDEEVRIRPAPGFVVTDDPAVAGPCDLVIPAVKAHQLADALATATPMAGATTQVLPFQNGVEAPEMVAEVFGSDRSLIGVARIFANIIAPGEITQQPGPRSFTIGDPDGAQSGRAAPVIAAFRAAGLNAPDCADVRVDLWSKFLFFNAISATTAGARTRIGTVRTTPALWSLFETLARETEALARARGIPLPDDVVARALEMARALPETARASTAHDLEEGRALEVDWLCGAVARLGAACGVPTPASATVAALLAPWRNGAPA